MEKALQLIKQEKSLLFILFASLVLRLAFLSPWLEDWDSVQFALALHDFSITDHQPHSPGYPLYILLGRLFYFFTQNDTSALTLLSAFTGTLAVLPLYLLARKMFNKKVAIFSSIFFAVTPISWMMSEVALTNMPGLFFLLVFAYLLYLWRNKPTRLILVSGFGGFILGFRFTEFPVIAALLVLAHLRLRKPKYTFYSFLAFMLGTLLWVVPILRDTGINNFVKEYSWIANYVIRHDALQGGSSFSPALLTQRLGNLWYILRVGYTPYFLLLSILSLLWIYTRRKNWKKSHLQFLLVWFLAYAIPSAFFYNLEVPRYALPYSVPLAILSASFLTSFKKLKPLSIPIFLATAVLLFNQGWSQVTRFKNSIPPTIAPVLFVKENFSPEEAVLLTSFTYRQFQYYAPEYSNFYVDKITSFDPGEKTVIIDHPGIKESFPVLIDLEIVERHEFRGDPDIFSRVPKTNLFVLTSEK